MVTMENAEEYVELMFDLCMHTGIQKQMEAFRGSRVTLLMLPVVMVMEFTSADLLFIAYLTFFRGF